MSTFRLFRITKDVIGKLKPKLNLCPKILALVTRPYYHDCGHVGTNSLHEMETTFHSYCLSYCQHPHCFCSTIDFFKFEDNMSLWKVVFSTLIASL